MRPRPNCVKQREALMYKGNRERPSMMYVRIRYDVLQVLRILFSPCSSVKGS